MKIGIVIHSHTGNTLSVAEKLKTALKAAGHEAVIERVTAVNEDPHAGNVQLKDAPDIAQYEAIVFGAPVRGFSLSAVMNIYLTQLRGLTGKKIVCYVTEHFPKPWMGGSRAIKQMVAAVGSKGAKVTETGVINWTNKRREEQINELATRFAGI